MFSFLLHETSCTLYFVLFARRNITDACVCAEGKSFRLKQMYVDRCFVGLPGSLEMNALPQGISGSETLGSISLEFFVNSKSTDYFNI